MCEHMTITFIPLDAPASGDPGGDLRWRSSLPAKLGPSFTRSWVTTGLLPGPPSAS